MGVSEERKFCFHDHSGKEGLSNPCAKASWNRTEVELVTQVEREPVTEDPPVHRSRNGRPQ